MEHAIDPELDSKPVPSGFYMDIGCSIIHRPPQELIDKPDHRFLIAVRC